MEASSKTSLAKEEQHTNADLEYGPANEQVRPAQPTDGSTSKPTGTIPLKIAQAFTQLFKSSAGKGKHVEKPEVYRKLMDWLDDVEECYWKFNSTLIAIELIVFLGLLSALICSLTMDRLKHHRLLRLRIWQYVTMSMMLASGVSVIRFITTVLSWPVKRMFRVHKYVVYFTRQLKRCVDVTLWFCTVLLGWYLWFRPRLKHVHGDLSIIISHQVTRFLIALCIGSFLWLLKNILYLKLEADLHYDQLFDRVRLSVAYLHGLQIIHKRGMWRFLTDTKSKKKLKKMEKEKEKDHVEIKEILMNGNNIWMEMTAMEKESVPIWILRRLAEEYLKEIKLNPLPGNPDLITKDEKILKEVNRMFRQLKTIRADLRSESGRRSHQHTTKSVNAVHLDLSDYEIKRDDLVGYELTEEELNFIFNRKIQEDDEEEDEDEDNDEKEEESKGQENDMESNGDIPIRYNEFLNLAVRAYKNCWGLERTLYSSKRVFIKLDRLLSAFLVMVMLIVWLLLSKIVTTAQLALLFTPFLGASFIFGDSCKKMFEGLIFAFAMHPFDVGDRVIINNAQMRVKELNILTSVFYKYDTGEEVTFPNSVLTTTSIINLDITPDQSDKVEFAIPTKTPLEDIKDLEIKIKKWLDDDIRYSSNNKVVKSEIANDDMKMTIYFKYLVSYLTAESKAVHKSKILSMIMSYRNNMEMNKKEFPPSYKPYIVKINLRNFIKLKDIEHLIDEIMRGLEERYRTYSKVVIVKHTKHKIKMGLYVGYAPPYTSKMKESEIGLATKFSKNICKEKKKKNLEDISEGLKRIPFVRGVVIIEPTTINNGEDEVIAQGGVGWGSFQANDVIQLDNSMTPSETIPSGTEGKTGDQIKTFLAAEKIMHETTQSEESSTILGSD